MKDKNVSIKRFLMCERDWVYFVLISIAGFFGAYTFSLRGNVFCNAQTGNVVLMGIALGTGRINDALYYLIPISAYLAGAFVSEAMPKPMKRKYAVRWDTLLIAIEMVVVFALGCIPLSAPVQISQVAINFIASMQYATFRQAEGVPMATTFVTNHIRAVGVGLAKGLLRRYNFDEKEKKKLLKHFSMIIFFILGASLGAAAAQCLFEQSIWLTLIPFGVILWIFFYSDLVAEKDMMYKVPGGH